MNEVELAQKMIMNFFQGTLKNDFTSEQKEILQIVFEKVKIEYGNMRPDISEDAGEYDREEEKIIMSNDPDAVKYYVQTLIHEYGHALSNLDFYITGIHINSVIEEGMVELFKDLVIDFNKDIDIETYDSYKNETAITRTIMAGLHESKKDIPVMAKYLLGGTDKEESGFLEEAFGDSAYRVDFLEDENLVFRGCFVTSYVNNEVNRQGKEWLKESNYKVFDSHIRRTEKIDESTFAKIPINLYSKRCGAPAPHLFEFSLPLREPVTPVLPSLRTGRFILYLRLDQTVSISFSLINNIHLICLCITEYKEVMSKKLHLYTGIFRIHRLDIELLGTDDLYLLIIQIILLYEILLEESSRLLLGDQLGLILLQLPLDDLFYKINRYIHIITYLFRTDDTALNRDRNFDLLSVFLDTECNMYLCFRCKVLLKLTDLVLHCCTKSRSHFNILANNNKLHIHHPFRGLFLSIIIAHVPLVLQ